MFVIGQAKEKVYRQRVILPKEYNLRREGRKIYGVWKGNDCLYLSDEEAVLRSRTGKDGLVFRINIESENKIKVPEYLENAAVTIQGCISVIELKFQY